MEVKTRVADSSLSWKLLCRTSPDEPIITGLGFVNATDDCRANVYISKEHLRQ